MKAVSGSLRLEVAQYRDMAVFAQFGADVDAATKKLLDRGVRMTELLKQPKERILKLSDQTALLLSLRCDGLEKIPVAKMQSFVTALLPWLHEVHGESMDSIDRSKKLPDDVSQSLRQAIDEFAARWEA